MVDYIHITLQGDLIHSNLPESQKPLTDCTNKFNRVICKVNNEWKRHGKFQLGEYEVYLSSYSSIVTNKILKHYLDALSLLLPVISKSKVNLEENVNKNFRRLKHNIVTHSTNIRQELEKSFPIPQYSKGAKNQLEEIRNTVSNNIDESSKSILKLIKSSNLLRFEFDIYDLLNSPNPYLEFDNHEIHKIVLFNLSPYWFDLIQKNITINVDSCYEKVFVDPKSISVVLSLLFENATKYCGGNSEFCVKFDENSDYLIVSLEMTSLKINKENINKILTEGESGEYAKKLGLAGDGLGLSIANKLVNYNKGILEIETDVLPTLKTSHMGIPYERNRFNLKLKKAQNNVYSA